jgi:hypothetical protein
MREQCHRTEILNQKPRTHFYPLWHPTRDTLSADGVSALEAELSLLSVVTRFPGISFIFKSIRMTESVLDGHQSNGLEQPISQGDWDSDLDLEPVFPHSQSNTEAVISHPTSLNESGPTVHAGTVMVAADALALGTLSRTSRNLRKRRPMFGRFQTNTSRFNLFHQVLEIGCRQRELVHGQFEKTFIFLLKIQKPLFGPTAFKELFQTGVELI